MPKGGDISVLKRKARNTVNDIARVVTLKEPLSLKRRVNVYPPQVRDMIERVGGEPVVSLVVTRAPVQSFVRTLMNVISLGTYQQAVRSASFDQMFHLALHINGRYLLDKQAVIKLQATSPAPNAERMTVHLSSHPTIRTLIDNTRAYMGPQRFSNYNAHTNNCQDFILAVLEANGLLTAELSSFIKQDADAVFSRMPSITEKVASTLTDIGSIANRVIEGEGKKKISTQKHIQKMPRAETAWMKHVRSEMAKNPGKKLKDVLKIAAQSYRK
jgi:hypothetical protein